MNQQYSDADWPDTGATVEPSPRAERPGPARTGTGLTGKLAGLSLPRQVLALAVWPLMEQILNAMVGTVDLVLGARLPELGVPAADALGVAGFIQWLMGMLQSAVGVGAAALVARAIGGRHRRLANAGLGQALVLGVVAGLVMLLTVLALAGGIARTAGLQGQALELALIYLRIVALMAPLAGILLVGGACLRAAGDTSTPFWVMVGVNIVNVAASVAFVSLGFGVAGIAWGTVLGWSAGAVLIVHRLMQRRDSGLRLRLIRLRPHWHTMRRIIRTGLPNFGEGAGMWAGNFAILAIVGRLALDGAVGSHMIAIRLESYSFLTGLAVGIAAATLAGQYLGAGRPDLAEAAVKLCWKLSAGMMLVIGLAFLTVPHYLVMIISDKPTHLELVPPLLRIAGAVQIFFATSITLSQALRGAGDTLSSMLITYTGTFAIRLPAAWLLGIWMGWELVGVWLALCGELVVRAGLFAGRFLHGGWKRVEV